MNGISPNPCRTCGNCCRWYVVGVSGFDIWRISSQQRLHPMQFLIAYDRKGDGLTRFRLEPGGEALSLALDKRGQAELEHTQPCVFLMTLRDGHERCGIYADRPDACRIYPFDVNGDAPGGRETTVCPPDSWPADTWTQPRWSSAVRHQDMNADVYSEVVTRWNARVAAMPAGTQFTADDYVTYILNVYDALAKLDASFGEEAMAQVRSRWRGLKLDASEGETLPLPVRRGDYPWLDYFAAARQIIDGFYPQIEPQPIACSWGKFVEFVPDDV
jgi:Fe-S-cluster containining protein